MKKIGVKYQDDSGNSEYTLIHAVSPNGTYDTLCGIDANDEDIGHMGAITVPSKTPIDCPHCKQIVECCKRYSKQDFV